MSIKHDEIHDFDECRKLGEFGESVAVMALSARPDWGIGGKAESMHAQKVLGVDYVATFDRDRGTLEIKTDMRGFLTGNVALETNHEYSNGRREAGWMHTTTATFIAFLLISKRDIEAVKGGSEIPRAGWMLVMRMHEMRRQFDGWLTKYPLKKANNATKVTWFCAVPRRVLEQSDALIARYQVEFGNRDGALWAVAKDAPAQGMLSA